MSDDLDHMGPIDFLVIEFPGSHFTGEGLPLLVDLVDRNIIRMSIYEFLHEDDTPKLVIIDEAIEIAKKYGTQKSSQFINGILDGILKRYNLDPDAKR